MKTKLIFAAAAMTALLASCNDSTITEQPVNGTAMLTVSVSTPRTRAVLSSDDKSDLNFQNVQIFIYDKDNKLEKSSGILSSREDIVLPVIPGHKTVWAVVNAAGEISAPQSLDLFPAVKTQLSDNTLTSQVMSGFEQVDAVARDEVTVTVKHIASKVIIDNISRNFTNQAYSEIPMKIRRIYMSNVAGDCDYGCTGAAPTVWLGKRGLLSDITACQALLLDDSIDFDLPEEGIYDTAHTFYVYPNPTENDNSNEEWSERKTRLVIECEYNGLTCYYPITVPKAQEGGAGTIDRNKVYHITSLTLTRPGSTDPDRTDLEVSSLKDVTFSITIADWEEEEPYTETF